MNTRPACPLDDTLARFASGELDDAAAAAVTDHLSTCELCETRLDRWNVKGPMAVGLRAESSGANAALARAVSTVLGEDTGPPPAVNGYILHEEIGRGGMGRVFRATHPRLNRDVAVKLLRPGLVSGEVAARFAA